MTLIDRGAERKASPRGTRHRLLSGRRPIALALMVFAVAGAVALAVAARARTTTGPLTTYADPRVDEGTGVNSLHVGESFCYGSVLLYNPTRQAATLQSVQIHGGAGLSVGAAQVLGRDRDNTVATGDTCPPAVPLRGYVVTPGGSPDDDNGVEVLLPVRIDRSGKHRITGLTVTYRVNGDTFTVDDTADLVACTYECEAKPGGR